MYVQNIYTILHDFRRPVESATIEIEITIGNDRNLKLRQTSDKLMRCDTVSTSLPHPPPFATTTTHG